MNDFVVIRAAADLPEGFLPPGMEGRWFDRATLPFGYPGDGGAVAVPTGRFETNDSGQVAEVFEVRP